MFSSVTPPGSIEKRYIFHGFSGTDLDPSNLGFQQSYKGKHQTAFEKNWHQRRLLTFNFCKKTRYKIYHPTSFFLRWFFPQKQVDWVIPFRCFCWLSWQQNSQAGTVRDGTRRGTLKNQASERCKPWGSFAPCGFHPSTKEGGCGFFSVGYLEIP